uniref:Uncharacterized protein n=1 Tax=Setaria viridis TaxID=4556 RepID=A0A4U6UU63_SETVI|nr:hypothetical protein SEVIR_4G010300v2 [Setaria viridis]
MALAREAQTGNKNSSRESGGNERKKGRRGGGSGIWKPKRKQRRTRRRRRRHQPPPQHPHAPSAFACKGSVWGPGVISTRSITVRFPLDFGAFVSCTEQTNPSADALLIDQVDLNGIMRH